MYENLAAVKAIELQICLVAMQKDTFFKFYSCIPLEFHNPMLCHKEFSQPQCCWL